MKTTRGKKNLVQGYLLHTIQYCAMCIKQQAHGQDWISTELIYMKNLKDM